MIKLVEMHCGSSIQAEKRQLEDAYRLMALKYRRLKSKYLQVTKQPYLEEETSLPAKKLDEFFPKISPKRQSEEDLLELPTKSGQIDKGSKRDVKFIYIISFRYG
jgi:hypothetical protein